MSKKTLILAAALMALATPALAGSVENLERERSGLVSTMLAPDLSPGERQESLAAGQRRLVDLERMVLRDKTLSGRETTAVRMAFANYDLTFLVLASGEKNLSLTDHWLEQMGLSTETLQNARKGRR